MNPQTPTFRYPLNNIESGDDYFKIHILKYQPPGLGLTGGFALRTSEQALDEAGIQGQAGSITKPLAYIILPMPSNIADNNSADWTSGTMDPIASSVSSAAQAAILASNSAASLIQSGEKFFGNLKDAVSNGGGQQGIAAAAAAMAVQAALGQGSINQLVSRATGQAFNQNVELLFGGVTMRPAFTFIFDMVPRSEKEAQRIKEIIRTFKVNMTPRKGSTSSDGNGLFITAPNVFKLEYMSGPSPHPFLHRFKPCALTGMSVNYNGSARYMTYSDATPVHMQLTLNFQELSPIYREDYFNDPETETQFKFEGTGY
jgi:hypothetical protein